MRDDYLHRAWLDVARYDADHNGSTSAAELDAAVQDPHLTGRNAAALSGLRQRSQDIPVTSFNEFKNTALQTGSIALASGEELTYSLSGMMDLQAYQDAAGRIEGTSRQLFNGDPDYKAIQQGNLGDCYFLSTVASLARKDPGAIKRMIAQNQDGTYTVKFPGIDHAVNVSPPTDAEIGGQASAGKNGLWLSVLGKAWQQVRPRTPEDQATGNRYLADRGGLASTAILALTGNGVGAMRLLPPNAPGVYPEVRDELNRHHFATIRQGLSQGRLVVANSAPSMDPGLLDRGLSPGHSYSVISCSDDSIVLRDPAGKRGPAGAGGRDDQGFVKLSVSDFTSAFELVVMDVGAPPSARRSSARPT